MSYQPDLSNLNLRELKTELKQKVVENQTIDQQRVKISDLLTMIYSDTPKK